MRHRDARLNHILENWTFVNQAARLTLVGALPEDIGKVAFQESDKTYWRLVVDAPLTWVQIGGGGGSLIIPINESSGDNTFFDLLAINQGYSNLLIEGFFRCYDFDFDDVISNLLIFFNEDYDDTGYRFSTWEDGVTTRGVGAPIISKSGVYGAHKISINFPMYSSVAAFPTCFAQSGLSNDVGDFVLRNTAIRNGPTSTAAITAVRIQTTATRLEFHGRAVHS